MHKGQRQNAILNLISSQQISKQEELTELLQKKGFSVNQSSVSRDLVELGIVKANGFYAVPTKSNYASFEIQIDWKIDKGCNSGLLYHVLETLWL